MKYITFDPFYSKRDFNKFLLAAFNNNIKYEVYIQIRPPYYFYLLIDDKDLPKFLDYEIAETKNTRFFNSMMVPRYNNEEVILKRKDSDHTLHFEKFMSNDVLLQAKDEECVIFFKFTGVKIKDYSRTLPDTKFYILGTKAGYYIGACFSKLAKSVISPEDILLIEENGDFRDPGELEAQLNYVWKPKDKLKNKTFESSYYLKGQLNLINKPVIKLS